MLKEMKDIEKKNEMLVIELQEKEMEIYKMKREHEREVEHQMEKYKLELQKYQERISQYERDRGLWENQMRQMKAQFVGLESNLEEREKFIQQYIINRPPSQMTNEVSAEAQIYQTMSKAEHEELLQVQKMPQHSQKPSDWFMRVLSQQQGQYSSVPTPRNEKSSNVPTMDFFTKRDKANQPSTSGSVYGSQWDEESF
jgi:DNA repair exonuclease SbcCD ATPase subunit